MRQLMKQHGAKILVLLALCIMITAYYIDNSTKIGGFTMTTKQELKNCASHKPKYDPPFKKVVKIRIYGGSNSVVPPAANFLSTFRYSSALGPMLTGMMPEYKFEIENHAVRASGVEQWVLCGIGPTDIVISEFIFNEGNKELLEKWYDVIYHSSQHFVILDLWSILTPPQTQASATIAAIPKYLQQMENATTAYSILSLEKMFLENWRDYISIYFERPGAPEMLDPFFKECLFAIKTDKIWNKCTKLYGNFLLHGNKYYHLDITLKLASHIKANVLPKLFLHQEQDHQYSTGSNPTTVANNSSEEEHVLAVPHSVCFSEYSEIEGVFQSWSSVIQYNSKFNIGPLFGREDKITLYTNDTSAQLLLSCPDGYNQSAVIGYITHGNILESGRFAIHHPYSNHSEVITTKLPSTNFFRIKTFTKPVKNPLKITVLDLHPNSYIQLTDFVCSADPLPDTSL